MPPRMEENSGTSRMWCKKLSLCCACIDVVLSMTVDSLIGKMRKNTPVKESSARRRIRLRLKAPDRSHFRKDQGRNASGEKPLAE